MKTKRLWPLAALLILALAALGGCAPASGKLSAADDEFLSAAAAVNQAGYSANGYFVNQKGQAGYFAGYGTPFNFIWKGATTKITGVDGRQYDAMNGKGTLIVKFMGETEAKQIYRGELKNGQWHGRGVLYDVSYGSTYDGDFVCDQMTGRGVYLYRGRDGKNHKYAGELLYGYANGRGVQTDLKTGKVIYEGLWLDGARCGHDIEQWRRLDAVAELENGARQYANPLLVGKTRIMGAPNSKPGQGPLVILAPAGVKNLSIGEASGRRFKIVNLTGRTGSGPKGRASGVIYGASENLPESAYPVTVKAEFDREGVREYVQFEAKRPFTMTLK